MYHSSCYDWHLWCTASEGPIGPNVCLPWYSLMMVTIFPMIMFMTDMFMMSFLLLFFMYIMIFLLLFLCIRWCHLIILIPWWCVLIALMPYDYDLSLIIVSHGDESLTYHVSMTWGLLCFMMLIPNFPTPCYMQMYLITIWDHMMMRLLFLFIYKLDEILLIGFYDTHIYSSLSSLTEYIHIYSFPFLWWW